MAKLSAFADEVTEDFLAQVEFLAGEKVGHIEPRFINKKNIMDLTKGELDEARTMIRDHGLKVSAIGSPIGKAGGSVRFGSAPLLSWPSTSARAIGLPESEGVP